MTEKAFLERFGIAAPIVLAPMAGGPSTIELAAGVAEAGGLGSLGAAYLTPERIIAEGRGLRRLTDKPFAINLFAGGWDTEAASHAAPMLALLSEIHERLGAPPPVLRTVPADPFPDQLAAVLDVRPAFLSFTFGMPDAAAMARLKARGIATLGTATTVDEARLLEEAGVDGIVAQGAEAGGHRGTFAADFATALLPVATLVRDCVAAVKVPVIASGGLMEGKECAAMLRLGAAAAQLGTAFLACPEAGTSPAYKQAVLTAGADTTVITRAFSGRPARGLRNGFIDALTGRESDILPYPLQNMLTRVMRAKSAELGIADYLSLWAGRGVARARAVPVGELTHRLVEECSTAVG